VEFGMKNFGSGGEIKKQPQLIMELRLYSNGSNSNSGKLASFSGK
jgi:hypothetical protein